MITLEANGSTLRQWVSLNVESSLNKAARGLALSLRFDDAPAKRRVSNLLPYGARCVVKWRGKPVFTGYAEDFEDDTSDSGYSLNVTGRSLSADDIDSECDGRSYENVTLTQFVRAIVPSAVVEVDAETGRPFHRRAAKSDEKRFEAIERAARTRGCVVTDNANGVLTVRKVRASTPVAYYEHVYDSALALSRPDAVLSSRVSTKTSALFARYEVRGQVAPFNGARNFEGFAAVANEPLIAARNRVKRIKAEAGADKERCLYRAVWEAQSQLANAVSVSITVRDWGLGGVAFEAGQTMHFTDTMREIDADLIVRDLSLSATEDGATATLVLVHPQTFDVIAPNKRKASKGVTTGGRWAELAEGAKL